MDLQKAIFFSFTSELQWKKSKFFFKQVLWLSCRSRVLPLDAFQHFLNHFQKENLNEDKARQLIEVKHKDLISNNSQPNKY